MLHPGFQVVNKDTAKALLQSKTIPDDAGTQQMLGLIRELKIKLRKPRFETSRRPAPRS
jgi:hypothetical protein